MSGLILLLVLILFWWGGVLLVRWVGRVVPNPRWKKPAMVGVVLVLLTAPFVDEVIGKYQFEALCKANGIEGADVSKARGRQVKVEYGERYFVDDTIMPIKVSNVIFRDAASGEVLIQHKNYYAMGGWLMRHTPLSMGSPRPMIFGGSTCDMRVEQEIFKTNSITFLYK
jgi:hypothetical protein